MLINREKKAEKLIEEIQKPTYINRFEAREIAEEIIKKEADKANRLQAIRNNEAINILNLYVTSAAKVGKTYVRFTLKGFDKFQILAITNFLIENKYVFTEIKKTEFSGYTWQFMEKKKFIPSEYIIINW